MGRVRLGRPRSEAAHRRTVGRFVLALLCAGVLLFSTPQPYANFGALAAGQSQPEAVAIAEQPTATPTSVYWGAFVNGWPGNPAAIDSFERMVGKSMSLVAWGAPWWQNGAYFPFQAAYFQAVRDRGSIPVLYWSSWDYCCGLEVPQFRLATIIRGDHDAFLIEWARAARAWGHPLFMNFNSEMNGWWWPWSEQINGNRPGEFVAAWRHVVDIFRQEGATNVTWLWCVNIESPDTTPIAQLYPGDDYVDWTCMHAYNFGTYRGYLWQEPYEVFGASPNLRKGFNTYEALLRLAPDKPIMVAETSSSEHGGSKAAWIYEAFATYLPRDFPRIQGVVWYGWPDPYTNNNWNVDSSPDAPLAFAESIALPRYVTNRYRNIASSPIPPPDGPTIADGAAGQTVQQP
jgi:hypothetical protein